MTDLRRKVQMEGEVAAHLTATRTGTQRRQGKTGEDEAEAEAGNDGAILRGAEDDIGVGTIDETISTHIVAMRRAGRILVNVTITGGRGGSHRHAL